MKTWMVRAGKGGDLADLFHDRSQVAIGHGGEKLGALPADMTRAELQRRMTERFPNWKLGKVVASAGQVFRFLVEFAEGDAVVTYDVGRREYLLGTIAGPVDFAADDQLSYRRKVIWKSRIARDGLSADARNTLGSILSVFLIPPEVADELVGQAQPIGAKRLDAPVVAPAVQRETLAAVDNPSERAKELLEDRINLLEWDQVQELVAGILRAMGYKTRVSDKGADRGVDIFASPDGLGLQEPRIFVEVKHRYAAMSSQDLRSFLGGRKPADRCLYVSTGGFTKDARYEAERSPVPLTLVDLPSLRQLVLDHYERLDEETRALVPLMKIYWPLPDED